MLKLNKKPESMLKFIIQKFWADIQIFLIILCGAKQVNILGVPFSVQPACRPNRCQDVGHAAKGIWCRISSIAVGIKTAQDEEDWGKQQQKVYKYPHIVDFHSCLHVHYRCNREYRLRLNHAMEIRKSLLWPAVAFWWRSDGCVPSNNKVMPWLVILRQRTMHALLNI